MQGLLAGDTAGEAAFVATIQPPVRANVERMLGPGHADADDLVQECVVAVIGHVRARGGFVGNLQVFAVTVARNRCRSHLALRRFRGHVDVDERADILADPAASPLDLCEEAEVRRAVRQALAELDDDCRRLLEDVYLRDVPIEALRQRLGLGSVQAVYHRRCVCLRKVSTLLNRRLFGRSGR